MTDFKNLDECKARLLADRQEAEESIRNLEMSLTNVSFLYQAILALAEENDKNKLYKTFVQKISRMFSAEICVVYGIKEMKEVDGNKFETSNDHQEYFVITSLGTKYFEQDKIFGPLDDSFVAEALTTGKIVRHDSNTPLTAGLHPVIANYQVFSSMTASVKATSGLKTVVQLNRLRQEAFTNDDGRMLLILLDRLSSVVSNINIQEDLRAKTNELIKMQNLMIGREIKMINLKKELKKLKGDN